MPLGQTPNKSADEHAGYAVPMAQEVLRQEKFFNLVRGAAAAVSHTDLTELFRLANEPSSDASGSPAMSTTQ